MRTVAPWLDAEAEAARVEGWQVETAGRTRAIDGAAELLEAWPHERLAIVTSGSRELARARLAGAGLPAPAVLVSADDVRAGKPDPEGYRRAAALLGVPPERCLAVEDAPAGIAAARAAGARTVALASTHAPAELAGADLVAGGAAARRLTCARRPRHADASWHRVGRVHPDRLVFARRAARPWFLSVAAGNLAG